MPDSAIPADLAEVIATHRALFGGFTMMADDGADGSGDDGGGGDQPRTFTQDQVDQMIQKRLAKFRDYDDLQKRAAEYDKVQEASKTELQKALERVAAAEKERDDLKAAEQARKDKADHEAQVKRWAEAAAKKAGVPANALKGDAEEEIKAHAALLASLLPRKGYVANEGDRPSGDGSSELREFTRKLFNTEDK